SHARVVTALGRALTWGGTLPSGAFWQGLSPGRVELRATTRNLAVVRVTLNVRGIELRDGQGVLVDLARSHASLERTPPTRFEGAVDAPYDDFDALRVVLVTPDAEAAPVEKELAIESVNALGARVDAI